MDIKTVPHSPYSPDLAPCDFWLFPKLRGCCYETIEVMKAVVTKVVDMLTQEDFHGAFQKLLERYIYIYIYIYMYIYIYIYIYIRRFCLHIKLKKDEEIGLHS